MITAQSRYSLTHTHRKLVSPEMYQTGARDDTNGVVFYKEGLSHLRFQTASHFLAKRMMSPLLHPLFCPCQKMAGRRCLQHLQQHTKDYEKRPIRILLKVPRRDTERSNTRDELNTSEVKHAHTHSQMCLALSRISTQERNDGYRISILWVIILCVHTHTHSKQHNTPLC